MVDYTDPKVWGSHFWFMMRCIANTYSEHPSREQKHRTMKFYEDLKYLLPCETCKKHYIHVVNKFPVSDYVCCKNCLMSWVETVYSEIDKYAKKNQDTQSHQDQTQQPQAQEQQQNEGNYRNNRKEKKEKKERKYRNDRNDRDRDRDYDDDRAGRRNEGCRNCKYRPFSG